MTVLSNSRDCPKCGSNHKGKPFCVYSDGYHCFSCGAHKKLSNAFTAHEPQTKQPPRIPSCEYSPNKFSVNNLKWLARFYVTPALIVKYNIAEFKGGLIFPSYDNNRLICYQQRWNNPLNRVVITRGTKIPALFAVSESRAVCVVEDFISAIRLHNIGVSSCCLWGTKLDYRTARALVHQYEKIIIWLDNDSTKEINSGQEAAKKICFTLNKLLHYKNTRQFFCSLPQTELSNLVTELDPKAYGDTELLELIGAKYESL